VVAVYRAPHAESDYGGKVRGVYKNMTSALREKERAGRKVTKSKIASRMSNGGNPPIRDGWHDTEFQLSTVEG